MTTQAKAFLYPLPMAIAEKSETPFARAAIEKVKDHILSLERQAVFFDLRELLASDFPEVTSIRFDVGSHYNDEGYSNHINLRVVVAEADGSKTIHEADEEYGSFKEDLAEKYNELSDFIGDFPDSTVGALAGHDIDVSNERALARNVMGVEGFARYEAAMIEAAAKLGGKDSVSKPRL